MGDAAIAAARAVGYVSAGTVEFLLHDDGFWFLEMNTRLQVEHPVTEAVTGLDLVRLQLLVAQGEPLPPEATAAEMRGHAVEARIYAEDAATYFLPATGTLHRFRISDRRVRVDAGVEDGSEVTVHYDPMLAKVIAHAPTRSEAVAVLAAALAGAEIHGVTTNRDLLVRVLRHPEFVAGEADTGFFDRHDPAELGRPLPSPAETALHAVAAAVAAQVERRGSPTILSGLPSGWRNNPSQPQRVLFEGPHGPVEVGYRFARAGLEVEVDGVSMPDLAVGTVTGSTVDIESGGVRRSYRVNRHGWVHWVDGPEGCSHLVEHPRFAETTIDETPGSLHAPMPGRVVKVLVAEGDPVEPGQALLVLEAMKMEHTLRAPHAGRVTSLKAKTRGPGGVRPDPGRGGVRPQTCGPPRASTRCVDPSSVDTVDDVVADLDEIERSLDAILEPLDEEGWRRPTPAEGWSIGDTVSHLAWFEEQAELAARDPERFASTLNEMLSGGVDGYMAVAIDLGREKSGPEVLDWWRRARGVAQDAFRGLDPAGRVVWFGPSMASRTFVGARVMETFAHGTDVADAVGVHFQVGGPLRHVAALGVKTFGWSFQNRGLAVPDHRVRVELTDTGRRGAPLERDRHPIGGRHARGLLTGGDPTAPRRTTPHWSLTARSPGSGWRSPSASPARPDRGVSPRHRPPDARPTARPLPTPGFRGQAKR